MRHGNGDRRINPLIAATPTAARASASVSIITERSRRLLGFASHANHLIFLGDMLIRFHLSAILGVSNRRGSCRRHSTVRR